MRYSSFTAIVIFLCLSLAGVALIPQLPVKLSPSYTLPRLSVSFSMPGHSSRVVEMQVTSRLEAMLARIGGIREMHSNSDNGGGRITLELDRHADVDAARFEASAVVRQAWPEMPAGLSYPVVEMSRPDDTRARPFLVYTLNAAATPIFIQRYAEDHIKPRLAHIDGLYRLDVTGATPLEWHLEYDSRQLATLEITVDDIREAIARHHSREFLGIVRTEDDRRIRLVLAPETGGDRGFDPSRITLATPGGHPVCLNQLLTVSRQEEAPHSYYRINGLNSIYLSFLADESANQLQLAAKVKAEMDALRLRLPAGYEMHTSYDATEYIRAELDKIYFRTALTLLVLLLFVLLLTRNPRYLFLIAVSLTVNLCVAVIFYYLSGLEMQLYSLAGITVSLSLIIDNTIVMAGHIRLHHNRNAFLPVLAATLTTVGALAVIFFLDGQIRLSLQDFAAVVIINLAVSLLTALFLVPALVEKMRVFRRSTGTSPHRFPKRRVALRRFVRRLPVWISRFYARQIELMCRWRTTACILLVLAFGLPVFLAPDKIEMKSGRTYSPADSLLIRTYNDWMAGETYREKLKPAVEKALGGTLRLFVQKVYEGSYFTDREETVLTVTASLPNGSTLNQMNHLIGRMEAYLSTYPEIRQFQTSIYNARQARIDLFFTRQSEHTGFPYTLKSRVISKALELGGGSWGVWGLQDQGFSNDVREHAGSYRIEMFGYNYDELYEQAQQLRDALLVYPRIREVLIGSEFSWWKDDYREFYFQLDRERMAQAGVRPVELFAAISPVFGRNIPAGYLAAGSGTEQLKLASRQSKEYDLWNMRHVPQAVRTTSFKLDGLATVEMGQTPQQVAKINQQYRLCLQYEYIGASRQGMKIRERVLTEFNAGLPTGYSAKAENNLWRWGENERKPYALLLLIVVIIFFTTGILFNSLKQPLAVIGVIPVSYIGVFLTFYLFRLNFDQGGFASFVLLCGITVNAGIYILDEYNRIRRRKPLMPPLRAYLKAWNAKVTPIFLTVISTVLGFIPFLSGETREAFWFPLAAGAIGGLMMSIAGIYLYLPVFTLRRKRK
ncbi:MAG: efflux RND transporter permease subunit [Tannerella sp.]|jgi:multidrug efflux pump subunit AcrB|nr:efflux RND transporter permease subunit [Tannerella sp.]